MYTFRTAPNPVTQLEMEARMYGEHKRNGYSWQVIQDHQQGCFAAITKGPNGYTRRSEHPSYSRAEEAAIDRFNAWIANGLHT